MAWKPKQEPQTFERVGPSARREDHFVPASLPIARAHVKLGEVGLMQLMPSTAKFFNMSPKDLEDPDNNLKAGTAHFNDMVNRYHGDVRLALAAYNDGAGNVDKAGGGPPQSADYVKEIMRNYGGPDKLERKSKPIPGSSP